MVEYLKSSVVLGVNFSQDQDLMSLGTVDGFLVFTMDPFQLVLQRAFKGGIKWA